MSLEEVQQKMEYLKMQYAPGLLPELVDEAAKNKTSPLEFFEQVLKLEVEHREQRRVASSMKLSGLPKGMHLDNFDYMFQPAVEKQRIQTLATCEYIKKRENVLFFGPPGVGNYVKFSLM
jgi:DNA replication protein DnaC